MKKFVIVTLSTLRVRVCRDPKALLLSTVAGSVGFSATPITDANASLLMIGPAMSRSSIPPDEMITRTLFWRFDLEKAESAKLRLGAMRRCVFEPLYEPCKN